MLESNLIVFGKRKRKFCSYQGENAPAADNLIQRDFHAAVPNLKWLTDITEFTIPAGKGYLAPIIDCFDGLVTSWSIGTRPDAELVNSMLRTAVETLKPNEKPIVHSDRYGHFRWPSWLELIARASLTRLMSGKGCTGDNAVCEGFFGRIKNEMFYGRSWIGTKINEFIGLLNEYLHWYNGKRIKISLGAISPLEYRRNLGLVT